MALKAWRGYMSARKREFSCIMIVCTAYSSRRMALIAGEACIDISSYLIMLAVHIRLIVRVAVNATKGLKAGGIGMAVGAGSPGSCMFT